MRQRVPHNFPISGKPPGNADRARRGFGPLASAATASSPPPLALFVEGRDQHWDREAVFRATGLCLDGNQPLETEHPDPMAPLLQPDRVCHQLLVTFADRELAKHVELPQVRLEVDVARSEQLLPGGQQVPVLQIEAVPRVVGQKPGQQPVRVLRRSPV